MGKRTETISTRIRLEDLHRFDRLRRVKGGLSRSIMLRDIVVRALDDNEREELDGQYSR